MNDLKDPVRYLKGVGPKKSLLLESLGVRTVWDLLNYFPFRIDDFSRVVPMDEVHPGDEVTVRGKVMSYGFSGRALRIRLTDGRGIVHLVWYNMPYMLRNFKYGDPVVASGKVEWRRNGLEMPHPKWKIEARETGKARQAEKTEGTSEARETGKTGATGGTGESIRGPVVPVYHSTSGLKSETISQIAKAAVSVYGKFVKPCLPPNLLAKHGLVPEGQAYRDIHDPSSKGAWEKARRTLAFREMLLFQMALLSMKKESRTIKGPGSYTDFTLPDAFVEHLPFRLTQAQVRAISDIKSDLSSGNTMNRLLQGDVGSGKTVVAIYALLAAVGNGWQGALLAPTEILAKQHLLTIHKIGVELAKIGFLSGSSKSADRKNVLDALRRGELDVLIGTHAILGDKVKWHRLGVVVTDEQHRFGVKQRLALAQAEEDQVQPHVLVMSATPIPRSLALTLYGDLDVSIIDAMPPGRTRPETVVLDSSRRLWAYKKIREEVSAGRQAYVVCPLIKEGLSGRKAAEMVEKELETGALRGLRLGIIHGDLPKDEAENTITAFGRKEIDVLISTTVIEVGIDVPNATVMVVEDADSFGLATLHQLRGRVGRGSGRSYCFLISSGSTEGGVERLKAMETMEDGLSVAEADLRQRGPGEFFGTAQHGLPELRVADLAVSLEIVEEAREEAKRFLNELDSPHPAKEVVQVAQAMRDRFGDLLTSGRSR